MESDEEQIELLDDGSAEQHSKDVAWQPLTRGQTMNLYISHAFSTWNARGYEFATVCQVNLPEPLAVFPARGD